MHLDPATLHALAAGELPIASPVPLTDHLASLEHRPLWRRRSRQVAVDPAAAARVTGVFWAATLLRSRGALTRLPCSSATPSTHRDGGHAAVRGQDGRAGEGATGAAEQHHDLAGGLVGDREVGVAVAVEVADRYRVGVGAGGDRGRRGEVGVQTSELQAAVSGREGTSAPASGGRSAVASRASRAARLPARDSAALARKVPARV